MHRDERDVPAADEEAGRQIEITGVTARLVERLAGSSARRAPPSPCRPRTPACGEHHGQRAEREQEERRLPAVGRQEGLAERRQQELAERADGRGDAERDRAPLGRDVAADRGEDHAEGRAAQREADQDAGAEVQLRRARGLRHQPDAERVEQAAAGQRAPVPHLSAIMPTNGCETPQSRFCIAIASANTSRPQPRSMAHGLQEQAEARADAERQQQDERATGDRDHGGPVESLVAHLAPVSAQRWRHAPAALRQGQAARVHSSFAEGGDFRRAGRMRPAERRGSRISWSKAELRALAVLEIAIAGMRRYAFSLSTLSSTSLLPV